jgi:hypothetical protein
MLDVRVVSVKWLFGKVGMYYSLNLLAVKIHAIIAVV